MFVRDIVVWDELLGGKKTKLGRHKERKEEHMTQQVLNKIKINASYNKHHMRVVPDYNAHDPMIQNPL